MKCKIISFLMCLSISIGVMCRSNKIQTIDNKIESEYTSKQKLTKKIKPKKKVVKKSKKEKELEYWSKVTGNKVAKVTKITAKISFYTDLDCENYQGCNGITSSGVKLYDGVVANNSLEIGTNIYFKGYGEYKVLDKGGKGLYGYNFDMYIPRNYGESDNNYYNRVNNLGIRKTTGYILKFAE